MVLISLFKHRHCAVRNSSHEYKRCHEAKNRSVTNVSDVPIQCMIDWKMRAYTTYHAHFEIESSLVSGATRTGTTTTLKTRTRFSDNWHGRHRCVRTTSLIFHCATDQRHLAWRGPCWWERSDTAKSKGRGITSTIQRPRRRPMATTTTMKSHCSIHSW